MATKAIGYVRVSTDKQADAGVSLDVQRSKLAAYASLYDLELVEVIEDAGEFAKSLDRPGIQRALAMLADGEVDALLVAKLDRVTRSVRDMAGLIATVFAPGKSLLLSVNEPIDTRAAEALIMAAKRGRQKLSNESQLALRLPQSLMDRLDAAAAKERERRPASR